MNSHIVNCLEPQPGSFTSTLRADAHPHTHASSGWGGAPLCIHRTAAGNPFYALEIAREIRRVGIPPPGQPLPVPADHRDLVLLRLRRLPRVTRDVLAELAAMPSAAVGQVDLEARDGSAGAGTAEYRLVRAPLLRRRPEWGEARAWSASKA